MGELIHQTPLTEAVEVCAMAHAFNFPSADDTGNVSCSSVGTAEGSATEVAAVDETVAGQETSADVKAKPVLGDFFAPSKRKTRLAKRSLFSAVPATLPERELPARSASPSDASSTGSTCASDSSSVPSSPARRPLPRPVLPAHLVCQANFWEEAARPESQVASKAASRAAWKRRGREGADLIPLEGGVGSILSSDEAVFGSDAQAAGDAAPPSPARRSTSSLVPGGRLSNRSATGLQRSVPRRAADDSRCHWLLSPESLLIRLDPSTGSFIMQQWLAYSALGRAASRARGRAPGRRPAVPARLHAGWLAQTLRPKGWLASIPERQRKNFPLPYSGDLVSEPDPPCGFKRQSSAALSQVIMREVFPDAIAEDVPETPEEADSSEGFESFENDGSTDGF